MFGACGAGACSAVNLLQNCMLHLIEALCLLQAVRPELADKDEHEDQTGLETLMEGDQKHHTQLPGAASDGRNTVVCF